MLIGTMPKHITEILILVYVLLTLGTLAQDRRKLVTGVEPTEDADDDDEERENTNEHTFKTTDFDSNLLKIIKVKDDDIRNEVISEKEDSGDNAKSSDSKNDFSGHLKKDSSDSGSLKDLDVLALSSETWMAKLISHIQDSDFDNEPADASANKDATSSELWSEPPPVIPDELSPEERAGMMN